MVTMVDQDQVLPTVLVIIDLLVEYITVSMLEVNFQDFNLILPIILICLGVVIQLVIQVILLIMVLQHL